MKNLFVFTAFVAIAFLSSRAFAQSNTMQGKDSSSTSKNLYMDIHHFAPGKVKYDDVAKAHAKDVAVEQKYGVNFINYWVNEKRGIVVCLSQAPDSIAIINTHKEAHGLIPDSIMRVKQGE